jgi:hypothetical protein
MTHASEHRVLQIKDETIIGEYASCVEAAQKLIELKLTTHKNKTVSNHISTVCTGTSKSNTYLGYEWKYIPNTSISENLPPPKTIEEPGFTKDDKKCIDCGTDIYKTSERCMKCDILKRRKVTDRPSKDILLELLKTKTYVAVGKIFNVTDSTIRKWLK